VEDQVTGWKVPIRFCVEQRGGLVDANERRGGSRDEPNDAQTRGGG